MYKFSKSSLKTLSGVYGPLEALVHSVLSNSKYDFGIPSTGGKRTADEQNKLFKKGWSKLDGYNKKSYHQSGMAIDIALYDEHGLCYECKDKYERIKEIMFHQFNVLKHIGVFPKESYIRWGGDWKTFVDIPHFELRNM